MSIIIVFFVNLARAIRNAWRLLLRRRVDYVRLELSGGLPEFASAPRWWQRRFLGMREPSSLQGLRRKLERVAADPQVSGVLLRINGLAAGWATLQSLRDEIGRLRRSGKRVVAYLVTPDMAGYYAACAADAILVPPTAFLTIVGLRSEVQFLRDALAKVGVTAEVEAVSPYKSAGETFVRSDISPENREQLERLLDQRFAEVVRAIGAARGQGEQQVRAAIDAAPLSGPAALERGLVDGLCYEDELEAYLGRAAAESTAESGGQPQIDDRPSESSGSPAAKKSGKGPIVLDWDAAQKALRLQPARRHRKLVAVVPVEGTIATGGSRTLPAPIPLIGGQQAGSDSVAQALRQVERNRRVSAVVLYVNSRGGDAFASDLIWREVLRVRRSKPVVVAMGDVAASGGYYIAAPASEIVAQPGTLTGSIGVVSLRPIVSGLLDRAGVNTVVLSRGAHSGLLSIVQAPSEGERQSLRDLIFASYHDFLRRVREGRDMTEQQLEPIAGGRVWTGSEALELGLVDRLGGLPEAVLRAQELAGLPQDRAAPLLVARGGRGEIPPQPFPANTLLDLWPALEEALRPRILAILPFDGI
ncbi:MAG: signal peptide peptidase SppA [Kouleothrix sp.]|nr:signal peptide peptidase SppA [Kouleothrix sp.]